MGQVRHGCATTTHAVRAAIQRSQASLATLGRELGINPKTVAKWRKRTSVEDLKTEPKAHHSTTFFEAEEAMIVAFQRHTLLPLDDCPYALQPSISARGASGLQGWRRNRVYPDFLLRLTGEGERLLVLETKGKQFDNDDTAFKRQLMAALQNAYERPAAGEVELFEDSPEAVRLTMLMQEDNWKPTLAGTLGD